MSSRVASAIGEAAAANRRLRKFSRIRMPKLGDADSARPDGDYRSENIMKWREIFAVHLFCDGFLI